MSLFMEVLYHVLYYNIHKYCLLSLIGQQYIQLFQLDKYVFSYIWIYKNKGSNFDISDLLANLLDWD